MHRVQTRALLKTANACRARKQIWPHNTCNTSVVYLYFFNRSGAQNNILVTQPRWQCGEPHTWPRLANYSCRFRARSSPTRVSCIIRSILTRRCTYSPTYPYWPVLLRHCSLYTPQTLSHIYRMLYFATSSSLLQLKLIWKLLQISMIYGVNYLSIEHRQRRRCSDSAVEITSVGQYFVENLSRVVHLFAFYMAVRDLSQHRSYW